MPPPLVCSRKPQSARQATGEACAPSQHAREHHGTGWSRRGPRSHDPTTHEREFSPTGPQTIASRSRTAARLRLAHPHHIRPEPRASPPGPRLLSPGTKKIHLTLISDETKYKTQIRKGHKCHESISLLNLMRLRVHLYDDSQSSLLTINLVRPDRC